MEKCSRGRMVQVGALKQPLRGGFVVLNSVSVALFSFLFFLLFPVKFLVEQENEQVDVDGGPLEELHHRHAFVLQLEEILVF